MADVQIRPGEIDDLPQLTEIYNHYVLHTPVTFDLDIFTVEQRMDWFRQFSVTGRYRLLVAEKQDRILGYASTMRFREKAAYDTTVEATIYCAREAVGEGLGRRLGTALLHAIEREDIHRIIGGYTVPNPASASLLKSFGFQPVGIFRETGRKFDRYGDVAFMERPLHLTG